MKQIKFVRVLVLAAILAVLGAHLSFANCTDFFPPVFQCANLAYFDRIPNFDPNVYNFTDPNDGSLRIKNVSAAFWQIGFGNNSLNTGAGFYGTGIGGGLFNGNDQGAFAIDLRDGKVATANPLVPAGSLCLSSNNWANTGIDGCCDNNRTTTLSLSDDGILNPYYDVYASRNYLTPGYYSLDWQQDYPMAALLKNVDGTFFAFAAIATFDRGNTGAGENGACNSGNPGTNPAPCDLRAGFYDFSDVSNGGANAVDPNKLNVIPWQATPDPNITSNVGVDPNDPNSDRVLSLAWSAVTIHSDQSVRPSTNPAMGGGDCTSTAACPTPTHDSTRAPGVGVSDIAGKFGGLVRYRLQVASPSDPNFLTPSSQTETASTSISGLQITFGSCIRLKTIFGKKPESITQNTPNCRIGKCGDIGYEVVSTPKCVGASVCTATG